MDKDYFLTPAGVTVEMDQNSNFAKIVLELPKQFENEEQQERIESLSQSIETALLVSVTIPFIL